MTESSGSRKESGVVIVAIFIRNVDCVIKYVYPREAIFSLVVWA